MTLDFSIRLLTAVLAPIAAITVFLLKDGHRRARLAARAKTAADLVEATPPDSHVYQELTAHLEYELERYLHATQPPTRSDVRDQLAIAGIFGLLGSLTGSGLWVQHNPDRVPEVIGQVVMDGYTRWLSAGWQTGLGIFATAFSLSMAVYHLVNHARMSAELKFNEEKSTDRSGAAR
ncbi:hypothetical protein FHX81_1166 [Saccharothrix saharensis]|uniref:Uncharacterized protein n=1 Tax=Saccharothrix saharensis TaxID=571190 RepID=A0A543J7T2_9PSEU|nr:hypothetical protein [Saccharothrix saharensis]TQM78881.1 hypothetical protein FHX81_1166 [Saccharothrix saharensis]